MVIGQETLYFSGVYGHPSAARGKKEFRPRVILAANVGEFRVKMTNRCTPCAERILQRFLSSAGTR
jgi:hypothetical protein